MIDISIIVVGGLFCFVLGWHLGHAVGVNDGLRRAHDIFDEVHRDSQ